MRSLFHNTSRVSLVRRLAATLMLMLFVFPVFTGSTFRLSADEDTEVDYLAEYEAIFYDSYDGLVSAQINAVAQTDDGYIWVGTYSGLYRYDGQKFAKSNVSSEIYSVMALYVDSKGVLWIGTNDSGLFGFDPATGEVSHISVKEGLPSDSIRSLAEDRTGRLFVGTVSNLAIIGEEGSIAICDESKGIGWSEITGIRSLGLLDDNVMAGVTNAGALFFCRGSELVRVATVDRPGVYYTAVSRNNTARTGEKGRLIAGTSDDEIELLSYENGKLEKLSVIDGMAVMYFNDIFYDADEGGYFFCGESGMGFLSDRTGRVTYLMQDKFQSSVSGVCKDYQGNIWFVSNKQGIIEYSRNPFMDVFVRSGLVGEVVNSVILQGNDLFIGMDNGLRVVDVNTFEVKNYSYIDEFEGVRIRNIFEDSQGNIWVSTYGRSGLVEITKDGGLKEFNEATAGTLGGRFRLCCETEDGTILAASNMGLNYIKDGQVVDTLGENEGLSAAQILTIVPSTDGSVLVGSDGDGVYRIRNGEVIDHIGNSRGLTTLVVLRIVPCEGGYLYVTSNAIYHDNGTKVRKLDRFPYSNNYDVFISEDGQAWISSSAGIYIVKETDLIQNGDYRYTLLDYNRGFTTSLTANAWNAFRDGMLYLCCTDGVRRISTGGYDLAGNDYFIALSDLKYDETSITADKDGIYRIPSGSGRIEIDASIFNYSLSNPLIHMYLEGTKDDGITMFQKSLTPLNYTNLPYGNYTLHIQVLDVIERNILRDEVYRIYKEPAMTELFIFKLLITLAGAGFVAFVVWRIIRGTIIKRQMIMIREAKEEAERANSAKSRFLANISHEIRTPINTIMGMDEMILREDRKEAGADYSKAVVGYARSIKSASESLLGLVNDILDLSKAESGKMNLVEREYDTTELLRGVSGMIGVRSEEKGLEFKTDIDPHLPKKLYGDDGKIKQVLLNLLTNAVKYTPKGGFTLSARICDFEESEETIVTTDSSGAEGPESAVHKDVTKRSGSMEEAGQEAVDAGTKTLGTEKIRIRFAVSDTGIGIRPEDMDKLFTAFERLDEKKNSGIQGTGLGLDISQKMVELMGSELKVTSVYGEGSEFSFEIEQTVIVDEPIGEFTESAAHEEIDVYKPLFVAPEGKVLVVDDSDMNLKVVKRLLKDTKLQVDTVLSGAACLDAIDARDYHIVLLDHMMPGMDGIETVHRIREKFPDLPVFALTANAATSGTEYYISEGFNGYLAKPVEALKLEETLKQYIPEELQYDYDEYMQSDSPKVRGEGLNESADGISVNGSEEQEETGKKDFYKMLAETDGINVSDGVKFCGSKEGFVEAAKDFYEMIPDRSGEIERLYDEGNIELYTIKVHALKSAARMVGAGELSKLAESLEDAGKSGDTEFIGAHSYELLEIYRKFTSALSFFEESTDFKNGEEIDGEMLEDAYASLAEVCEVQDYDSAEMIIDSLKEYRLPDGDAERMHSIEKSMKQLDWDEMIELIRSR
ncbi:MAG: response regulator [Lachnospiraceae bacterium]|nr:response regulator [Lachnospiraceae bacterium]